MSSPQIITANRLGDGLVVFFVAPEHWVERLDQALVFEGEAAERALADAKADEAANRIVEPYLVDVRIENGSPVPVKLREAIRAKGPTIVFGPDAVPAGA